MQCGPPFINCRSFMPNESHESSFLPNPKWIPHLRPVEIVVPWELALPLVHGTCGPQGHVDVRVPSKFHGIVKKTIALYPMPTIIILAKSGHFTIKEYDSFPFCLFFAFW